MSAPAREALEASRASGTILVSAITAWGIAMLAQRGRIGLATDVKTWLDTVALLDAVTFVPIETEIAILSTRLGGAFHKDPAGRFIVATCLKTGSALVSADRNIQSSGLVETIW